MEKIERSQTTHVKVVVTIHKNIEFVSLLSFKTMAAHCPSFTEIASYLHIQPFQLLQPLITRITHAATHPPRCCLAAGVFAKKFPLSTAPDAICKTTLKRTKKRVK